MRDKVGRAGGKTEGKSNERDILLEGRNLVLRPLAKVERVPDLAISCKHMGEYPNCRQRAFMPYLMEADAEICREEQQEER